MFLSSYTSEDICILSPELQNIVLYLYLVHVRTKIKLRKSWKKPFASLEAQWELRVRITLRINQFTREYDNTRKWWYCNKVFFFFFFLWVAETLKIKRECKKAWEQKWPEGEMTKTSLEMQRMVVQECCFTASSCETPFCLVEGGERDHSPVTSDFLMLFWIKWNSSRPSAFLVAWGFLNRECWACGKATVIANLEAACGLSCCFHQAKTSQKSAQAKFWSCCAPVQ